LDAVLTTTTTNTTKTTMTLLTLKHFVTEKRRKQFFREECHFFLAIDKVTKALGANWNVFFSF
jgi:hypothetical protein